MGRSGNGQTQQDPIHRVMQQIFQSCDPGLSYRLWDGSTGEVGTPDGTFAIVIRNRETFRTAIASGNTGELATAFVDEDIDIEGDLLACLRLANQLEGIELRWWEKARLWWLLRKI